MFAARRARRTRSDVSLVTEVLATLRADRVAGDPIPVHELPVAVGLANLHADVLAAMPLRARGRVTPRVAAFLEAPNPEETRHQTVHKIVQSAFWTGSAGVLTPERGPVDAVTVLDPNRWHPEVDEADSNRVVSWWVDGVKLPINRVRYLKINDDPRRGPLGRAPLTMAGEPLRMYGHAYRYLSMFFEGGGNPSTVLQRTGVGNTIYTPEEAAEDWVKARQARRPAVLPSGWQLSVPPANGEMEAIARILEKCAAEVGRLVNAPPSLINAEANGSMTYSTVDGEIRRWMALSLVPTWISRLEDLWTALAGVPVEMDTDVMFRLVSPTTVDPFATPVTAPVARLEAVA